MNYKVDPGLYALGSPGPDSPVLVSANYKMSFDRLREVLPGRNAWLLVLDTDGINVWCAAGKGTFGTDELVERIRGSALAKVVNHRLLIVPQLGAPGISAHTVKKLSGFKVVYGPVRASDLPKFLDSGLKANPRMRIKTFTIEERLVLIPVEMVQALKLFLMALPFIFVLSGFGNSAGFLAQCIRLGSLNAGGLLIGVIAGGVITPILLPWLPGRAFSVKGILPGIAGGFLFLILLRGMEPAHPPGFFEAAAWLSIIPAISAYLAMNFTGCSTFTSLSGVEKEMRWAIPLEIAALVIGVVFWTVARFL
jgi:hypothetical protein